MEVIQGLAPMGLALWLLVLLLPWRPWSTRESLDSSQSITADLADVTVLIPARNEADVITHTLHALSRQGNRLSIIVVDDQSTDGTSGEVRSLKIDGITLIEGQPAPPYWSGKLWALEQARQHASTDLLLLLDADIELADGTIVTLKQKLLENGLHLVSLMAKLRMQSFWERMLIPAFIYFFKLLYPFHLSNRGHPLVAAAAGGCILLRANSLESIGGFSAIKGALIDDCALAKRFREYGYTTWIGLTHSAASLRAYNRLAGIWKMITRTAFTQLRYSWTLLILCIALMSLAFAVPLVNLALPGVWTRMTAAASLLVMITTYIPTLNYYRLPWTWSLTLPLAGLLYLLMTCHSALLHVCGAGASWKGRYYGKPPIS